MKTTGFFIVVLSIFLAACANSSLNSANRSTTSSMPHISDGDSAPADQKAISVTYTSANSSNAVTNTSYATTSKQTNVKHLSVGQQVSLIKAEHVTESEYNTDRKIVRNAELEHLDRPG